MPAEMRARPTPRCTSWGAAAPRHPGPKTTVAAADRERRIALQAFGVTEAAAGSDTTQIRTEAVRHGDVYVVNGEKRWTSRLQNSDLMLLLAHTSASPPGEKTRRALAVPRGSARRERRGACRTDPRDDE